MKKIKINDKKKFKVAIIILIAIIVIIISIIAIIAINSKPKVDVYDKSGNKITTSDLNNITRYIPYNSSGEKQEELSADSYFSELESLLLIKNVDNLYTKMDKIFLEENGLNKDNFKDYLLDKEYIGNFPSVSTISYSTQRNGSCVYRAKCYSDSRRKYFVNIIEVKPFEYTINFSQEIIPTVDPKTYTVNTEDLTFEITELYRKEKAIAYKLKVTNNSEKEIEFYFNSISDMELKLENKGTVKQATSVLSSTTYKISKNSYFIKKLYFPLDMQYHSTVNGMTFYNVRFEDSRKNISIKF